MRKNNTTWDEYFFGLAMVCASRSKDPSTTNGAVIVNEDDLPVGLGYNGFLKGLEDVEEYWNDKLEKYKRVYHAERNAIANANNSVKGCKMYLWSSKDYFSCEECASSIIQHGILEVHFMKITDQDTNDWGFDSSKELFEEAGVKIFVHEDITDEVILRKLTELRGSCKDLVEIKKSIGKEVENMKMSFAQQIICDKLIPHMQYVPGFQGHGFTLRDGDLNQIMSQEEAKIVREYLEKYYRIRLR